MPIFMDRHDVKGVTAEKVAKAHQEDLKIQHKHNCRALTYWFDEARGTAFCLIEAPERIAVKAMHDEAHGLIPHQIIEVNSNLVESFLGRIEDPKPAVDADDSDLFVFQDSAYRSILVTELKDAALLFSESGIDKGREVIRNYKDVIQKLIRQRDGRIVASTFETFTVSFASISESVECAVNIQKHLNENKNHDKGMKMHAGIGLNAGDPVTENAALFGDTIQFAERLCYIADAGQIKVSAIIKEQYKKEKLGTFPADKSLKPVNSKEEIFINRLLDTTEKIWNKEGFKVETFCRQIGVSKSELYRKIKNLTGSSPADFMRNYRLKNALELIEKQSDNIARIAYETGFNNPSYFSKCFKKRYGLLPSEYLSRIN